MTTIPEPEKRLLDFFRDGERLVMDNHQLRCERDAAQGAQWRLEEEIERLKREVEKLRDITARHNDEAIQQDAAWCREREDLRRQLADMTAARDEACEIAEGPLVGRTGDIVQAMRERLAELRKVGAR